jgi:hypothetical protein
LDRVRVPQRHLSREIHNTGFENYRAGAFPKNCVCDHLGADAKKTQIIRNSPAVNINRNASSIIAIKPSYAKHPSG